MRGEGSASAGRKMSATSSVASKLRISNYLTTEVGFEEDRAFWVDIFTQVITTDEMLAEWLEQHSIYWQDDLREVEKAEVEDRPATEDEALQAALNEGS